MTGGQWRLVRRKSAYSGAVVHTATRPHPETPGHTQEITAPTLAALHAALHTHHHLDAIREQYGARWIIGADEVMPTGRIRWVWAQPRQPGRYAPRPVDYPAELRRLLEILDQDGGDPVSPSYRPGLIRSGAGTPDP